MSAKFEYCGIEISPVNFVIVAETPFDADAQRVATAIAQLTGRQLTIVPAVKYQMSQKIHASDENNSETTVRLPIAIGETLLDEIFKNSRTDDANASTSIECVGAAIRVSTKNIDKSIDELVKLLKNVY